MKLDKLFENKLNSKSIKVFRKTSFDQTEYAINHGVNIEKGHCFAYVLIRVSQILSDENRYIHNPDELLEAFQSFEIDMDESNVTSATLARTIQNTGWFKSTEHSH